MWVEPVTIVGKTLRLEPLTMAHAPGLHSLYALNPDILLYHGLKPSDTSPEAFTTYMERSLATPGRIPFAIVMLDTGLPAGTTSYLDIKPADRGLEIGYTWLGKRFQGTQVNPENKYMLLRHAFETLGAIRVQLKTDGRNLQSQHAMLKMGAQYEGTLRKHVVLPDGYLRDSAMFSITDDEWPSVKSALESRLGYTP
jgi:ribosomal-protein-alanine N-acetyltransferase